MGKPPAGKSYRVIIDHLQRAIESGQYRPGDKLPSEKELCKTFGVSRSSVREALCALEYVGLVEVRGGSGYYVTGNTAVTAEEELTRCATKIIVTIDDRWNIKSIKKLLAIGVDGITVVIDSDSSAWARQVRAVRQAASDLGITAPVLLQLSSGSEAAGELAAQANVDGLIVLSTEPEDILKVRRLLDETEADLPVFARIVGFNASNVEDIMRVSDGWIVESGALNEMYGVQIGQLLAKTKYYGKIALLAATLQSARECSDLIKAIAHVNLIDYDGFLLSLDGMARKFPLDVLAMFRNCLKAQEEQWTLPPEQPGRIIGSPMANALCVSAVRAGEAMKAVAYVVPTETGLTPRLLAKFRPPLPIIAVSHDSRIVRQLRLVWGVQPLLSRRIVRHEDVLALAVNTALKANHLHDGDAAVGVVSSMDVGLAGNIISLLVVGDIIIKGQGVGSGIVSGRVSIINSLFDVNKSVKNRIMVIKATEAEHVRLIEEAAGLIVEEGGLSSHAVITCLSLGKPVRRSCCWRTNRLPWTCCAVRFIAVGLI